LGLHGLVQRGTIELIPLEKIVSSFSLTLPGTGGSRVQRHVFTKQVFLILGHGMDAAALYCHRDNHAENAKGVFYDN
jgi:hypothetical protein